MICGSEKLSFQKRLERRKSTSLKTTVKEVTFLNFKKMNRINDMPVEYLFQVDIEVEKRLRWHRLLLTKAKLKLDIRRLSISHREYQKGTLYK